MFTPLSVIAGIELVLYTATATNEYGVFCPQSAGDETIWGGIDIGINIWSSSQSRENDCFLRVSTLYNDHSSIGSEWINPSNNMIVLSHGWQPNALPDWLKSGGVDHYIPDQWGYIDYFSSECVDGANKGDVEKCAPMDHDAQFWIENGWNVLYIDWVYYAAEPLVFTGEEHIYNAVHDGKSVNLLYDLCPRAVIQK